MQYIRSSIELALSVGHGNCAVMDRVTANELTVYTMRSPLRPLLHATTQPLPAC